MGEDKSTAGAWAAAAVVLALGALAFGVTSHLRVADLEAHVDTVVASLATTPDASTPVPSTPVASRPSTTVSGASTSEPPDPDGARAGITEAFATLYDASRPTAVRVAAVDDPDGVARALARVEAGPLGEVASEVSVTVDDISFTSDTRAIVTYTLTFAGLADVAPGAARPGSWEVDGRSPGPPCVRISAPST